MATILRQKWRDDPFLRLVVSAVVVAVYVGVLVYLSAHRHGWPHALLILVAAALATAAVVLIAGAISLKKHPERAARRRETDEWVRTGVLPDSVSLGDALPRIAARIARYRKEVWTNVLLLAIWIGEALLQLSDRRLNAATVAFFAVLFAYSAMLVGWSLYRRIRWTPVLRRLLTEGQRRLAEPRRAPSREGHAGA